jgi:hypothetical protein
MDMRFGTWNVRSLYRYLREIDCGVWIGFDWLRTGTGGGVW